MCKTHEIEILVVKEEVQEQKLSIEHISIVIMIVNPLMKGLSPKFFSNHVEIIGTMEYNC
jgi:hypothetical protein